MGRSQARPAQPRSWPGRSREPDKLPSSNPPAGWAPTAPDTGVVSPGHQGNWRRYARLSAPTWPMPARLLGPTWNAMARLAEPIWPSMALLTHPHWESMQNRGVIRLLLTVPGHHSRAGSPDSVD